MTPCTPVPAPDGLQGAIFALEGVLGAVTVLNGPTGCKYYHSSVSDGQLLDQAEFDPFNELEQWYFGQPRVPCTYLDGRDYVVGSKAKLADLLAHLAAQDDIGLISVVNSPGAALIGDDLKQLVDEVLPGRACVVIDSPGFSCGIAAGHEDAAIEVVRQVGAAEPGPSAGPSVNLVGFSVFQKYWLGDAAELTRLLGLCGVAVNCAMFADCRLDDLRNLGAAQLTVVVRPEFGVRTAAEIEARWGVPTLVVAPPVGFAATEEFMIAVCSRLGCDPAPGLREAERARGLAYTHISRVNSMTGLPKGVPYAVKGTWSEVGAWMGFLTRYFGMTPVAVEVTCPEVAGSRAPAERLLVDHCLAGALDCPIIDSGAELVFADAGVIAALRLAGRAFTGVEIALPTFGYLDVIAKAHLGLRGALMITEQVLNGLLFGDH